jgi:hypothetical protein
METATAYLLCYTDWLQSLDMVHAMDLRIRATECRREAARLEALARSARDRGGDHCCRDWRGIEQELIAQAAEAEGRARLLEAAGCWS